MAMIDVLVPAPPDADERGSATFDLGHPVRGARIGLRLDPAWRSYYVVVDEWTRLLQSDGAEVHVLVAGERVGPTAVQTRADIDEWARLIEVGVIGLGN
jgi:hypothetical protein